CSAWDSSLNTLF
nr:immunoglobulin light chain junction region [Macaca mulatta]MPN65305.1 immunoglobulin light chain junction region [Macaca mulatta]MPN65345.1 immunoglobulin light chain junction region [Macaca mulatta]MPN65359.1 immunoglobulin light chain junction region [Macaca mulatta]MPN65533.1 immunoglobulin light chain junction region [Macaca mulatta]